MRPSLPRRHFLQAGALGTLGLTLPDLLRTEALAKPGRGKSGPKSCIYLFLYGGPSQIDLWDMKPAAPEEFRGEFKPISTSVPGVQVCEHLPRTAKLAKHFTIVRTLTHANKNHNPAGAWMLTGLNPKSDNAGQLAPKPDDPPALGSLASRLAPGEAGVPPFVMLPARMFDQGANLRGQTAGWLGPAYDPLLIAQDPSSSRFRMDMYEQRDDLPPDRLQARRELLKALDRKTTGQSDDAEMGEFQQRAFDLLNGARGRSAFDLSAEPASVRDRYGRTMFGQGCLLARRLVEAGARLVTVSDTTPAGHHQWDTHSKNFMTLKNKLLPKLDQAYSALLEDLLERGLLEDTVVYLGGEFGRTPKVGYSTGAGAGKDGRDHWPNCFSAVVAGGRFPAGAVYGVSDSKAGYPSESPVTPEDMAATLFAAMGLDPEAVVQARDGRPMPVSYGKAVAGLVGG